MDKISNQLKNNNLGIYIHIPFCNSRCYYCDFCSSVLDDDIKRQYVNKLILEMQLYKDIMSDYIVDTIYIGGGTPTCLPSGLIESINESIFKNFNTNIIEFTIEGNPNTFTKDKLCEIKNTAIDRVSVGAQSLRDNVLKIVGRQGNRKNTLYTLEQLTKSYKNVSADIMLGLPQYPTEHVLEDVDTLINCGINHLSAYALKIEDNTPLDIMVKNNDIVICDDDYVADMYNSVYYLLKNRGFNRYEVSNYGKDDSISHHNYKYWTLDNYLGLGASAHSLIEKERFNNTSSIMDYINYKHIKRENIELLTDKDTLYEKIMLGLRLDRGISLDNLDVFAQAIEKCRKYININGTNVSIKSEYMFSMNDIIIKFLDCIS